MALAFGPVILLAVVGSAVFAGLDMRKKKSKNGAASGNGANGTSQYDVVPCAHVIDLSDDGERASLDGGEWQEAEVLDDFWAWAVEFQRPQVSFLVCQSNPQVLSLIDQLCRQNPQVDFYGVYADRLRGEAFQAITATCGGSAVAFNITTPLNDTDIRYYHWADVAGLRATSAQEMANAIATIVAALQGADLPGSEIVEVG
jgi:hypothetical protein